MPGEKKQGRGGRGGRANGKGGGRRGGRGSSIAGLLRALQGEEWALAAQILRKADHAEVAALRDRRANTLLHTLLADDTDEDEAVPVLLALLACGCDFNAVNDQGQTPLILAAKGAGAALRRLAAEGRRGRQHGGLRGPLRR